MMMMTRRCSACIYPTPTREGVKKINEQAQYYVYMFDNVDNIT